MAVWANVSKLRGLPGSAVPDLDYVSVAGLLSWADGDTADKTVSVPLVNNDLVEPEEQFSLQLTGVTGMSGKLPVIGEGVSISVTDDDLWALSFTSPDLFVNENMAIRGHGCQGTWYGGRSNRKLRGAPAVHVQVLTLRLCGYVEFEPGQLHASFAIVVNDEIPEGPETINLILNGAKPEGEKGQRTILGTPNMATLTVLDNETLNEPAGSIDTNLTWRRSNDFVNSIAQQGDGRFLLGGDFVINGLKRNRIVRLNRMGLWTHRLTWESGWTPAQALAVQPDGG